MDMFRLLARSTKLKKSTLVYGTKLNQQIPSAGDPRKLDVDIHDVVDTEEKQSSSINGKKRKRYENSKYGEHFVSQNSDSLDGKTVEPASSSRSLRNDNDANRDSNRELHEYSEDAINDQSWLKAEDLRRLLKQHKLKIVSLNIDVDTDDRSTKRRKKYPSSSSTLSGKKLNTSLLPHLLTSFKELSTKYGISRRLAANLDSQGYNEPTEVQMGSLPVLLGSDDERGLYQIEASKEANKKWYRRSDIDLITIAPTGSGKTLAFLISTIHGILEDQKTENDNLEKGDHQVKALIVAPTHELADQIVNEGRKIAAKTGIKISRLRKGMMLHPELRTSNEASHREFDELSENDLSVDKLKLRGQSLIKADVLVSTPLTLLHAISKPSTTTPIPLPRVRYLVLDEADILLDPLFLNQTLGIWSACNNPALQTSLWSATIGSSIESVAKSFILNRRRNLKISNDRRHLIVRLVVGLKDSAVPNISHRLVYTASEQGKLLALRQLLHPSTASAEQSSSIQPPLLIFTQTIPRAIALHSELLYDISPEAGGSSRIAVLHADLSDRARSAIMKGFRKGEIWILITTDLLSRGIDFRGMNGVINYDIPSASASYVHRVGRTGRQGRDGGIAVTFYTKEDIPYVKNIANVIAISERASDNHQVHQGNKPRLERWLLDALPAVSKKTKKELKRKGVESRRATVSGDGTQRAKMRISTKSGYERRMENKRRGAVEGNRRRAAMREEEIDRSSGEEWGGIDD